MTDNNFSTEFAPLLPNCSF